MTQPALFIRRAVRLIYSTPKGCAGQWVKSLNKFTSTPRQTSNQQISDGLLSPNGTHLGKCLDADVNRMLDTGLPQSQVSHRGCRWNQDQFSSLPSSILGHICASMVPFKKLWLYSATTWLVLNVSPKQGPPNPSHPSPIVFGTAWCQVHSASGSRASHGWFSKVLWHPNNLIRQIPFLRWFSLVSLK